MKWWKFNTHDYELVHLFKWWNFERDLSWHSWFISLMNFHHFDKTQEYDEFIAMLKIHYSDKASSLIGNSSPWWITLFRLKYLSHRSNEIYHLTEIYFSDKNSSPRWNFINLMKWWKFIPHDIVGIVDEFSSLT